MNTVMMIVSLVLVLLATASALLSPTWTATSTSYNRYNQLVNKRNSNEIRRQCGLYMARGGHGQNFKFLPMLRGSEDNHFPRIMRIAGVFPDLTPEELLAPPSVPSGGLGSWSYDFPDPDGPQLGIVAIPGSPKITNAIDPTVMITTNTQLGVQLIEEAEMLVVVDRGDLKVTRDNFYVFRTPNNDLKIEWTDRLEQGYEVLGKVILCTIPYNAANAAKKTGFMEEDDE